MRVDYSDEVRSMMNKNRSRWGSKQILNWLESNIETGRSQPGNLRNAIETDMDKTYAASNAEHRNRIMRRFSTNEK